MKDKQFVEYMKPKQVEGKCEIGIHPHAWNIPPIHEMKPRDDIVPGYIFLKEYPEEIIYQKIKITYLKSEFLRRQGPIVRLLDDSHLRNVNNLLSIAFSARSRFVNSDNASLLFIVCIDCY